MEGYGVRVQKSVFEIEASSKIIERLRTEIHALLNIEQDYVVYFEICERDWQKREKYGPGGYKEEDIQPYKIL
jgi:CRISPR-associated protein Cas2